MRALVPGGAGMRGHKLWQVCSMRFDACFTGRGRPRSYFSPSLFDREHLIGWMSAENLESVEHALGGGKPNVVVDSNGMPRQAPDAREPPALNILALLTEKGCRVTYHDPHVPTLSHAGDSSWTSTPLGAENLHSADCVVITTDHSAHDWDFVVRNAPVVFDTRNATRDMRAERSHVALL